MVGNAHPTRYTITARSDCSPLRRRRIRCDRNRRTVIHGRRRARVAHRGWGRACRGAGRCRIRWGWVSRHRRSPQPIAATTAGSANTESKNRNSQCRTHHGSCLLTREANPSHPLRPPPSSSSLLALTARKMRIGHSPHNPTRRQMMCKRNGCLFTTFPAQSLHL